MGDKDMKENGNIEDDKEDKDNKDLKENENMEDSENNKDGEDMENVEGEEDGEEEGEDTDYRSIHRLIWIILEVSMLEVGQRWSFATGITHT